MLFYVSKANRQPTTINTVMNISVKVEGLLAAAIWARKLKVTGPRISQLWLTFRGNVPISQGLRGPLQFSRLWLQKKLFKKVTRLIMWDSSPLASIYMNRISLPFES